MIVQGVYAAVLVPRLPNGELNESGFRAIVEFLRDKGLSKIVVNGATGEYCLTTAPELARMLAICRETMPDGEVLCSIGAAGSLALLGLGLGAGCAGVSAPLLPLPYLFPDLPEAPFAFLAW